MKKERRFAAIVAELPTDWREVSKCGPAEPTRTKRTIHWGIRAHLVCAQPRISNKSWGLREGSHKDEGRRSKYISFIDVEWSHAKDSN